MKTRKYFFLMLAAALFAACGSDESNDSGNGNGNGNGNNEQPAAVSSVAQIDNAGTIGMSYADMMQKYKEPTSQFGDFYLYEFKEGKVTTLMAAINPETTTVYLVTEVLAKGAYTEEELTAYFAGKYKYYGTEKLDLYDEDYNVIGQTNVYGYGNTEDPDKATLLITLTGNESVSFTNPQNVPAAPEAGALEDITPVEAVATFLMKDMEDIEDEYPDAFMQMNDKYMASMQENPYLMSISLQPVDGFVISMTLLYNEELTDQDIIDYYIEQGYTVTPNGKDTNGNDAYLITKGGISIAYSDARGVVTFNDEEEE